LPPAWRANHGIEKKFFRLKTPAPIGGEFLFLGIVVDSRFQGYEKSYHNQPIPIRRFSRGLSFRIFCRPRYGVESAIIHAEIGHAASASLSAVYAESSFLGIVDCRGKPILPVLFDRYVNILDCLEQPAFLQTLILRLISFGAVFAR